MVRRQALTGVGMRKQRFVPLGRRLLEAKDFSRAEMGWIEGGMVWTGFDVKETSLPEFEKLCKELNGRRAALVQDGEVWVTAELKSGLKTIRSPAGYGSVEPMMNLKEGE